MSGSVLTTVPVFPEADAVQKATQMASRSPEVADYLKERMTQIVNIVFRNNPETRGKIIDGMNNLSEKVHEMYETRSKPWDGIIIANERFLNAQEIVAKDAAKMLPNAIDNITIHFAISAKGQYVRGYTAKEGAVSEKETELLDKYFSQWLATHKCGVKDGFIYAVENDVINEKKQLSSEEVTKLIVDGDLDRFMESKGVYDFALFQRDYPEQPEPTPNAAPAA